MKTPRTRAESLAVRAAEVWSDRIDLPTAWPRHGRRQPYTAAGIRRLPCFRCGQPAEHQWNVCSDGNLWRPLCLTCDVALNRLVLEWMGFAPDVVDAKLDAYKARS